MDTASTLSQVVSSLNPHSRACFWTIPLTHHLCLAGMQQPNLGTGNATACSAAGDAQLSGKNWSSGEKCKKVLSGVTPLLYYCCAERERGREGGREGEKRREREHEWVAFLCTKTIAAFSKLLDSCLQGDWVLTSSLQAGSLWAVRNPYFSSSLFWNRDSPYFFSSVPLFGCTIPEIFLTSKIL